MIKQLALFASIVFGLKGFAQKKDLVLWYNQPAKEWNETMPIGNGFW